MRRTSKSRLHARTLVVRGNHFGNRTGSQPVMLSQCELTVNSDAYIEECERTFIDFSAILAERPNDEVQYEWGDVFRQGATFTFEIKWYDQAFFENRKEAYRVGPHPFVFSRFGLDVNDVKVVHLKPSRTRL